MHEQILTFSFEDMNILLLVSKLLCNNFDDRLV